MILVENSQFWKGADTSGKAKPQIGYQRTEFEAVAASMSALWRQSGLHSTRTTASASDPKRTRQHREGQKIEKAGLDLQLVQYGYLPVSDHVGCGGSPATRTKEEFPSWRWPIKR